MGVKGLGRRRNDDARHKARAKQRLLQRKRLFGGDASCDVNPVHVGAIAATPAACSCLVCGNPRRHFDEITLAEKRAEEAFRAGLDDIAD